MANKILGLFILLGVIGVGVYLSTKGDGTVSGKGTRLHALVGGEKAKLLKNPKVVQILRRKYGLTVASTTTGSIDMVSGASTSGQDFLWPSNQVAVEIFRNRGGQVLAEKTLFNSPMVIYSWDQVAEALEKKSLVETRNGIYYLKDLQSMIELIVKESTWKDMGLSKLYGTMKIFTTDPTRSNSGNMYAGLVANMLSGGEVASEQNLATLMPRLKEYFQRMGHMESSSGDLFETFLKTGMGAKPMIVGYESQLVEFSLEHAEYRDLLRNRVRVLYPEPTVWSSHPVIALTAAGKKFIHAMEDDEIQRIAWEEHGFRSGLMGVQNDPGVLQLAGLPQTIESVMPLPNAAVMESIIKALHVL